MVCLFKKKQRPLPPSLVKIKKALKKKNRQKRRLQPWEILLLEEIVTKTNRLNLNNITRTKAYLDIYLEYPEIHWAFLGHMVSRNGGYNMTDLKGEYLSRLLTNSERNAFFEFLERGNWLIFQDIFPQFLVYEASVKRGKNLFHLLAHLHVSWFMEVIWNFYWQTEDQELLTIALIVNEQSFLQSRVIQQPVFQKNVLHTIEFKIQDRLALSPILFPYKKEGNVHLIGATLHQFERLDKRIHLGKRLYTILFGDSTRRKLVEQWAIRHPHTGSRKDYWPELFNDVDEGLPGQPFKPKVRSCRLLPGAARIYSPNLEMAWKNHPHQQAEKGDWYSHWRVLDYFVDRKKQIDGEMIHEYCKTIEKLELAATAKKAISLLG